VRRVLKAQAAVGGMVLLAAIAAVAGSQGAGACTASTGAGPVGGVPAQYAPLFQSAAAAYNLGAHGASILAGIMDTESSFGTNNSTSSAGAMGPMQFEPGTWQTYGVDAPGHTGPPNIQDPADAIYSAANYLHALGLTADPSTWSAAVFGYNHSASYVSLVLSRAQQFYSQGLNSGGRSAVLASTTSAIGCSVSPAGYVNPFAHTKNLVPQRIDMGVDYDGIGEIDALGNARVTFAGTGIGGGWTCSTNTNGGVVYRLQDGEYRGRYVYVTEDIVPTVKAGDVVTAGQQIGTFAPPGGQGCIETGWASGPGPNPEAAVLGQQATSGDAGANRTYCGQQFSNLLRSLGAPGGLENQPLSGSSCGT